MSGNPILTLRPIRALAAAAAFALVACAPGSTVMDGPGAAPPPGWRFETAEHIALWYHGLAVVGVEHAEHGVGVDSDDEPESTPLPLPTYRSGYAESMAALRRDRGVEHTPLERRADEFRAVFADPAYRPIQFLPLYFEDREALFSGIRAWGQAGGNPRRAADAASARVFAFLSAAFPRAEQRKVIVDWASALEAEHDAFFEAYWAESRAGLESAAEAVAAAWDDVASELSGYLLQTGLRSADILLVPALGAEGRMVVRGTRVPRIVIASPSGTDTASALDPEQVIYALLREITYGLAGEAIREHVAPARIRLIGQSVLSARAATHAGLEIIARTAPERADGYRRFFIEQAGHAAPEDPAALEAAFADAFPLPDGLEEGLRDTVRQALAGI